MKCSLRTRLLFGIVTGILLLLIVFSSVVYTVIRRALTNQFDSSLKSTAAILAASIEQDGEDIEVEFEVQKMPEFHNSEHPTFYQLWDANGVVLARSPSLASDDLIRFSSLVDQPVVRTIKLPQGQSGRAVGLMFTPRAADNDEIDQDLQIHHATLTLIVARDDDDLEDNLEFLRWLLLIASAGTVILSVIVAGFVVRDGLAPLNSIASEISAIRQNDLGVRLEAPSAPVELEPVKNRLNDLLDRLEAAFKREKRFTGDVAHELRTPLSGMRSNIEVTLSRQRNSAEYRESLSGCLAITEQMQGMVESLLRLVRIEAGQIKFSREKIQLKELINSCWKPFSKKARERDISFDSKINDELMCETDTEHLSIILSNLLANAADYTNTGGRIDVSAEMVDKGIEVVVSNTGCELTSEEISQVFDCFWRGDSSRTDTGMHCGLGLALVQRIVNAIGGEITAELDQGGVFVVRLVLFTMGAAQEDEL